MTVNFTELGVKCDQTIFSSLKLIILSLLYSCLPDHPSYILINNPFSFSFLSLTCKKVSHLIVFSWMFHAPKVTPLYSSHVIIGFFYYLLRMDNLRGATFLPLITNSVMSLFIYFFTCIFLLLYINMDNSRRCFIKHSEWRGRGRDSEVWWGKG